MSLNLRLQQHLTALEVNLICLEKGSLLYKEGESIGGGGVSLGSFTEDCAVWWAVQ